MWMRRRHTNFGKRVLGCSHLSRRMSDGLSFGLEAAVEWCSTTIGRLGCKAALSLISRLSGACRASRPVAGRTANRPDRQSFLFVRGDGPQARFPQPVP